MWSTPPCLRAMLPESEGAAHVAISAPPGVVVAALVGGSVCVWGIYTGKLIAKVELTTVNGNFTCLAVGMAHLAIGTTHEVALFELAELSKCYARASIPVNAIQFGELKLGETQALYLASVLGPLITYTEPTLFLNDMCSSSLRGDCHYLDGNEGAAVMIKSNVLHVILNGNPVVTNVLGSGFQKAALWRDQVVSMGFDGTLCLHSEENWLGRQVGKVEPNSPMFFKNGRLQSVANGQVLTIQT